MFTNLRSLPERDGLLDAGGVGRRTDAPCPRLAPPVGLAVAAAWAVLAVWAGTQLGGVSLQGGAIALAAALGPLALGGVLLAAGLLPVPRAPLAAWIAAGALTLWAAVALASMAWSLAPQLSYVDGTRGVAAAAALTTGIWLGNLL